MNYEELARRIIANEGTYAEQISNADRARTFPTQLAEAAYRLGWRACAKEIAERIEAEGAGASPGHIIRVNFAASHSAAIAREVGERR